MLLAKQNVKVSGFFVHSFRYVYPLLLLLHLVEKGLRFRYVVYDISCKFSIFLRYIGSCCACLIIAVTVAVKRSFFTSSFLESEAAGRLSPAVILQLREIIQEKRFAVGQLHSLGHSLACQLQNNLLRKPQSGRSGGEEAEHVNSRTAPLTGSMRRLRYVTEILSVSLSL